MGLAMTEHPEIQRKRRPGWFVFLAGGTAAYLASLATDHAISFASEGWRIIGSCFVTAVTLWLILWLYDVVRR
ncbi:cell division protein FtsW (lipid II flippase) [Methylobacterium persicinum]|jgi:cell division protein FtsW (lipid II flippase)|uniref:Cell division protein FtsW (Lipid II flippase) n=1 Tax=Methylobacterium persicinum TaxID=374426 RepID=A0ABU0HM47_9HYPH|nr:cell division protein FtsW (lipid II flippase) [Methylobacterium persicinum]